MKKENIQSVDAIVEPDASMTIVDSFQYAAQQLKGLEERMQQSDRELYRTVGEFVDSTLKTVQNLAAEGFEPESRPELPEETLKSVEIDPNSILKARYKLIQQEFKTLLLTAFTTEEIDRLMKLDYLCNTLEKAIQQSAPVPRKILFTEEKLRAEFSSFKKAKEHHNLSASSWQALADKLNSL